MMIPGLLVQLFSDLIQLFIRFWDQTIPNHPDCSGTTTLEYTGYMVENINTELGYDIQSLSGEIGGTFGLMLGVCLLDLFTLWQLNKWILRFFKLMLWIAFLYWAAECIKKAINVSIATDISMNKANMAEDFPLLTFCKQSVFHYADETLLGRQCVKRSHFFRVLLRSLSISKKGVALPYCSF